MVFNDSHLDTVNGAVLHEPSAAGYAGCSYARVVAVGGSESHLLATCEAFALQGFPIYESLDGGRTWTEEPVALVTEFDAEAAAAGWTFEWQPTLLADGDRILLAGNSFLRGEGAAIEGTRLILAESTDAGRTWTRLSLISESNGEVGNLWEPEILRVGSQLIVYYATEAHRSQGVNQGIAHKVSVDGGRSWSEEVLDIYEADGYSRPGMPVVRKVGDAYQMAYEVCDARGGLCPLYISHSVDGVTWDADPFVDRVALSEEAYLHATPALATDGDQLLVAGMGAEGFDKRTIFARRKGEQGWEALESPLQWQGGNHHAGYSPALHLIGPELLVMASSHRDDVINEMRFAVGRLNTSEGGHR
jgi:hypothetical protein